MTEVPQEFKQFVNAVEASTAYKKPKFKSVKELQVCMKYFFERAVTKPDLSRKFAATADNLKLVFPESEKYGSLLNFRKILVSETRFQIEEVSEMLNSASKVNKDRAKGSYKFLGELYNIGFIFIGPLRTTVELLDDSKHESELAKECLKQLLETVRAKVLGLPDDNSGDLKFMKEILKRPNDPQTKPKPPQSNLLKTSKQFPDLAGSSWSLDGSFKQELTASQKVKAFEKIVKQMTTDNWADLIKTIEIKHKSIFDNDSWQCYYDVLMADAIARPHVAEPLVVLCQKLPKLGSAWNAVKKEDYQKYIFNTIAKEIEGGPTQSRENAIIALFKALVNKSLCSNIACVLASVVKYSEKNITASANILCKILEIIKYKFNEAKIQRLQGEMRRKCVKIIETKNLSEEKFVLLKNYLLSDEPSDESTDGVESEVDDDLCAESTGEPSGYYFSIKNFNVSKW